jgi:isoquinoline 1-oxidoreductase beta subunit
MSGQSLSRRHFLKTSGMVGGGIVVAVALPGCAFNGPHPIEVTDAGFIPNAFLQIAPDNKITFYCPSDEMGQGIRTGLATIIGEELDVDPANMLVQAAGSHEDYNNPEFRVQGTGGSNAVRVFYQPLRQVGADTRALLLNAAALDLGIPSEQLLTDDGFIVAGDRRYPYGDFVDTASSLEMPVATSLKAPSNFQYIGADAPRVDALAKATGTASFGIDTDLPGMVYAVVVRPPVAGSKALKFDDSAARIAPGVLDIVAVSSGIAVVAERYWQAYQAAKKLTVDWEKRPLSSVTSTQVRQDLSAALEANDDTESSHVGDPEKAFAEADRILETDYYAPFLAHAPMEPLNATLRITENGADLWTGVQFVGAAQGVLERLTGLPRGDIKIHNQFLGGGFGRRATLSHIVEVAEIAMSIDKPVQLLWSREDDLRHGFYRPAAMMKIKAAADNEGRITAWQARRSGANITAQTMKNALPGVLPSLPTGLLNGLVGAMDYVFDNWAVDASSVEGLHETYSLPSYRVSHASVDHGLPTTFWRSVGHSYTSFAVESMMDELAEARQIDPVTLRLKNLEDKPRMKNVVAQAGRLMAAMTVPEHHHLGFAAHSSFGTDVAQIAQVSVTDGNIRVHKVTCVVDCGLAVNPDIVRAQLEGAVMFALTATLYGQIDLDDGAVVQSNFHNYPILRMNESPAVDVVIIESHTPPTGIGEPGVPPLAPAVANAVYRATGQRLRDLPLKLA